jgi:hypothetical protein
MAETEKGKKEVYVHKHTKTVDGKPVKVPTHYRSTPDTSKGKKSGK